MEFVREIEELHSFFVNWYCGSVPAEKERFIRFSKQISSDFSLVPPSGAVISHGQIIDMIQRAHNSMAGKSFRIWIEKPALLWTRESISLVRYEEWQEREGEVSSRISTAVFEHDSTCKNGLRWLHVHETWLKQPGGDDG